MFKISCFADEIAPEFDTQLHVMKQLGIQYLSLRSVWGKNVLDLTEEELTRIRKSLAASAVRVSSIGSPIGKVSIYEDFSSHLRRLERALSAAQRLEAGYVRVFSFYMDGEEPSRHEAEVIRRFETMAEMAAAADIVLLHENEADIYGETSARCLKLLQVVNNPHLRAAFDPANFVIAGEDVLDTAWTRLKPFVEYMHIKDAKRDGTITPAGEGDGAIPLLLADLRDHASIFLTLEPHLSQAGSMGGFTGPELFATAYQALVSALESQGLSDYV